MGLVLGLRMGKPSGVISPSLKTQVYLRCGPLGGLGLGLELGLGVGLGLVLVLELGLGLRR